MGNYCCSKELLETHYNCTKENCLSNVGYIEFVNKSTHTKPPIMLDCSFEHDLKQIASPMSLEGTHYKNQSELEITRKYTSTSLRRYKSLAQVNKSYGKSPCKIDTILPIITNYAKGISIIRGM